MGCGVDGGGVGWRGFIVTGLSGIKTGFAFFLMNLQQRADGKRQHGKERGRSGETNMHLGGNRHDFFIDFFFFGGGGGERWKQTRIWVEIVRIKKKKKKKSSKKQKQKQTTTTNIKRGDGGGGGGDNGCSIKK